MAVRPASPVKVLRSDGKKGWGVRGVVAILDGGETNSSRKPDFDEGGGGCVFLRYQARQAHA